MFDKSFEKSYYLLFVKTNRSFEKAVLDLLVLKQPVKLQLYDQKGKVQGTKISL